MARLIWTFHGPRAAGIAEHHARHLGEFAEREQLGEIDVAVISDQTSTTVTMTVAGQRADAVAAALRPHRRES